MVWLVVKWRISGTILKKDLSFFMIVSICFINDSYRGCLMEKKNKYEKVRYDVENELRVINDYQKFMLYVYDLLERFPKKETFSLIADIKSNMTSGLEALILAKNTHKSAMALKFKYLNRAEAHLNVLMVLVRISVKRKYLKARNYTAWSFKISQIDTQVNKWIVSLSRAQSN